MKFCVRNDLVADWLHSIYCQALRLGDSGEILARLDYAFVELIAFDIYATMQLAFWSDRYDAPIFRLSPIRLPSAPIIGEYATPIRQWQTTFINTLCVLHRCYAAIT